MPKFNVKMRGYDSNQVDKYVEDTIKRIKKLQAENKELAESTESDSQKSKEISHAMIYAQQSSDKIQEQAQESAKKKVDAAKAKSSEITKDARDQAGGLEYNAKKKVKKLVSKINSLKTTQDGIQAHILSYLSREIKAIKGAKENGNKANH